MTHSNDRGFALVHLLAVIVAIVFLSSFLAKKASSNFDFKAAALTASRIDLLLNEAYTYYQFNGKWPFAGDNCLGGTDVVVGAAGRVIPNVIPDGWGDDEAFVFECTEVGETYSISYTIPDEWMKYIKANVSDATDGLSSSGETPMVSMINTTGEGVEGKTSEILVANFEKNGNKLKAELEAVKCKDDPKSTWTYSVSAMCNSSYTAPEGRVFPEGIFTTWLEIQGWRLKVKKKSSKKYEFEAESYEVEQKIGWFLFIPFEYIDTDWVAAEADCGDVGGPPMVPTVTAFVQCESQP